MGEGAGSNRGTSPGEGFPPKGITEWGDSVQMGDGKITTFSSVTPSSNPKYVGIHFAEGTLEGLPYAEDFESGDADGRKVHGFWSKPFNLDFPENTPDPISYAGCGWNPQGHTPHGVYERPHFDLHYHIYEPKTVAGIGPGIIENLPDRNIPDGYRLLEGGAIVPAMGAHLAPKDAPEFHGEEWTETLIWGVADVDGDGEYENTFIEPMITLDYFQNHLTGIEKRDISQPEVYPKDGYYPTTYTVRDLGEGGYAVVMEDFEKRSA
ncbi:hypothetical protein C474_18044 [Halogeometricum pallidum JCM 14848]|uniref:DUF5602 domain-containing protein n=1 Tax=Halogeometricum pallidum JCM 14848 TaxID=1227487 RepID=M0CXA2_HALPD|nr:hypothetical protein [Halogeometricum pallidum]ELZ27273.1 hypothetical protein C474_18044 [Halogeometricum pallidum JCM 14848]